VCKSKDDGALGVKDTKKFNIILPTKWKWHLGVENHKQWKEVLDSKYGSWRILNAMGDKANESCKWRDLRKVCGRGEQGRCGLMKM